MIQFETKMASCEITMEEITLQCGICSHILSVDAVNVHQCADVNNNDGANSDVPSDYLKQDIYTAIYTAFSLYRRFHSRFHVVYQPRGGKSL